MSLWLSYEEQKRQQRLREEAEEERKRQERLRLVAARNREAQNLYAQKQRETAVANTAAQEECERQRQESERKAQRRERERKQRQKPRQILIERQRKAQQIEATRIAMERQKKAQQREQEEIARQRKEMARKERERQETDHEINKLIHEKKLYRFDAITIEDKNKYKYQQKPNQHKDDILYNKHRLILKEWNQNSTKLETFAMSSKSMKSFIQQNINDDDDEKNTHNEQGFGDKLFNSYFECHSIINQQSIRLCQSTTNDYLLQLISRQNSLSKSVKEQELNTLSTTQKYDEQNEQYQTLKQQRTSLQNKIELEFKKCNKMIQEENQLFHQLQRMKRFKTESETEMNALKASSKSCVSVIKLYNEFMESNKQNIDKTNANFDKIWSEFESKWMKWTVKDMVGWFKYKTIKMNAANIDWMQTENQLMTRNITGKSLVNFNNLVFELIGIQDFDIVTHLNSAITILKKKYATNNSKDDKQSKSDKRGHGTVPAEFLCPITKQIMRDPVIAFDGHCYDRNAIESYLKIHKKSPKTGSTADYVIVFPNHKLKEDIQKYITINNIDLEQQNEGCHEGVSETAYM